ncbi:MAG TPA: S24 family peptidase [Gammaproteobacteria bacterium]
MAFEKIIPIKDETQPEADPRLNAFSSPCEGNEPYALMVLGDSMLPEFIEGDVIVIYPKGNYKDGSFVIAWHNNEYIFRQLEVRDDKLFIKALNPAYPTQELLGPDAIKGVIAQKKGKGRHNRKNYD